MNPQRRLKVGDKIPDFWARDVNGEIVDSKGLNAKHTLVVFLRYAGCPFCNLAIYMLNQEYKKLKKLDCEVVAFVQSTVESVETNILERQQSPLPFHIVADRDADLYKLFGVKPNLIRAAKHAVRNAPQWFDATMKKNFKQRGIDGQVLMVPAMFLVNNDNIVTMIDYDASLYDKSLFEPIYDHLRA